ncbi:hypothetical protein [Bradyrhizobium arachidis]|uniref:hypothetical protein n=1 Tax=Bradyrhizobium arachidis TaxID=858423 RepID=UPI0021FC3A60|nr:hypothetical protein KUF59_06395 [Bradyrhizobium arachidis]
MAAVPELGAESNLRAVASARRSHQNPMLIMKIEATTPSLRAADGIVPKNGIGMAFCIDCVSLRMRWHASDYRESIRLR